MAVYSDGDFKVDFDQVEQMADLFKQSEQLLEETNSEMMQIAQRLEDDVLKGKAGTALTQTIRTDLYKSVNQLQDKMKEMQSEMHAVIAVWRDKDQSMAGRFS